MKQLPCCFALLMRPIQGLAASTNTCALGFSRSLCPRPLTEFLKAQPLPYAGFFLSIMELMYCDRGPAGGAFPREVVSGHVHDTLQCRKIFKIAAVFPWFFAPQAAIPSIQEAAPGPAVVSMVYASNRTLLVWLLHRRWGR